MAEQLRFEIDKYMLTAVQRVSCFFDELSSRAQNAEPCQDLLPTALSHRPFDPPPEPAVSLVERTVARSDKKVIYQAAPSEYRTLPRFAENVL